MCIGKILGKKESERKGRSKKKLKVKLKYSEKQKLSKRVVEELRGVDAVPVIPDRRVRCVGAEGGWSVRGRWSMGGRWGVGWDCEAGEEGAFTASKDAEASAHAGDSVA